MTGKRVVEKRATLTQEPAKSRQYLRNALIKIEVTLTKPQRNKAWISIVAKDHNSKRVWTKLCQGEDYEYVQLRYKYVVRQIRQAIVHIDNKSDMDKEIARIGIEMVQ